MTEYSSPRPAPPLSLPPAAVLHDARSEPHPDSEEHIQRERNRTARELDTLTPATPRIGIQVSPNVVARATPHQSPYLRSRGTTVASSVGPSDITTAPDDGDEAARRGNRLRRMVPHWYDPVVKFWKSKVSLTIDEGSHRDHLANERTYLGYLRTSVAFSIMGVVTAQLFRLQHTLSPSPQLGFFVLGIPLSATFICAAIVVSALGSYRFFRQQDAMNRGKVHAGGFEISTIMVISVVVSTVLFFWLIFG